MVLPWILLACSGTDDTGEPVDSDPADTGETDTEETDTDPEVIDDTAEDTDDGEDDMVPDAEDEAQYAALFDLAEVQHIELELDEEALAALRATPEEYVDGAFTHDGVRVEVEVKLSGGDATFRTIDEKPCFRVKFDEDDDYAGLRRANLENMEDDASQAREVLGFQLWAASGQKAPVANYAEVWVNGSSYGLYANVEEVDHAFLYRHYSDATGDLWEAGFESDFTPGGVLTYELVSGEGDEEGLDAARRQVQSNDGPFYDAADEVIKMETFLGFWAWMVAIGNEDVYPYDLDDHYLYRLPADDRYTFLPGGMAESWDDGMDWEAYTGTLAVQCAYDEACMPLFLAALSAALDEYEALDPNAMASDALDISVPFTQLDTRRSFTLAEVVTARSGLLTEVTGRPNVVRALVGVE
jgi:hypothetical protein